MEWWNAGNPTFQSSDIPTFQYSNIPILRWLFVLAGIKFYDGLLVGDGLNLVARWDARDDAFKGLFVQRKPIGDGPAGGHLQVLGGQLAGSVGILDFDEVVHFEAVRGNV